MGRYTTGFSKDMTEAFNASKNKITNFNLWYATNPDRLTSHEKHTVTLAIKRARRARITFNWRKRDKARATKLDTDTMRFEKKNTQLRIELSKLRHKYNELLSQVNSNLLFINTMPAEPTTIIGLQNNEIFNEYELPVTWDDCWL